MQSLKDPESYMPGEAAVAGINVHIDEYNGQRPTIYQRCVFFAYLAMGLYCIVAGWLIFVIYHADSKGKAIGLVGGLAIMAVISLLMGQNPVAVLMQLLGAAGQGGGVTASAPMSEAEMAAQEESYSFVNFVLDDA